MTLSKKKYSKDTLAKIAYYEMRAKQCSECDSKKEKIEKEFWLAKARELK